MNKNEPNNVGPDTTESTAKKGRKRFIGIIIAAVLCAAAVVGVMFLVRSLTGAEPSVQTSGTPYSYDGAEQTSEYTEDAVTYSEEAAAARDSGAITDSGAGSEPEAAATDPEPETEEADMSGTATDITNESSEDVIGISGEASDEADQTLDSGNGGNHTSGRSSEPAVTADAPVHTSQTVPQTTTAPQTTTQTAAASTSASTSSTTRGTTAVSSISTSSYYFFNDVPQLEHDPETFEGVIGDFFN